MIITLNRVQLKLATDSQRGNVQSFLDRLLVEVASENYRYFLTEHQYLAHGQSSAPETQCWPPLLSNERQVSGLFATGLSRVSPVSLPEHPISRAKKTDLDNESESLAKNAQGRIDFLAYYGNRHIALELKRCPISTLGDTRSKAGLTSQWATVVKQSKEALAHMRALKSHYESPVSVGLLVVRVSRKVTSRVNLEDARRTTAAALPTIADEIRTLTKADYLSYYAAPREMQSSIGWGKTENEYRIFPGVIFAAVVHGNTR